MKPPRDPQRIPEIMQKLERLWLIQPDTRLNQLLSNLASGDGYDTDLFYYEDDKLLAKLDEALNEKE